MDELLYICCIRTNSCLVVKKEPVNSDFHPPMGLIYERLQIEK